MIEAQDTEGVFRAVNGFRLFVSRLPKIAGAAQVRGGGDGCPGIVPEHGRNWIYRYRHRTGARDTLNRF